MKFFALFMAWINTLVALALVFVWLGMLTQSPVGSLLCIRMAVQITSDASSGVDVPVAIYDSFEMLCGIDIRLEEEEGGTWF